MTDVHLCKGGVFHHVVDDGARHVHATGLLNAFQTRRRIDLQNQGAVVAFQQVNAGNVEPEHARRSTRCLGVTLWELDALDDPVQVEVASKFPAASTPSHASDNFVTNDKGTDVSAVRFSNVFLNKNGLAGHEQSLNEVPNLKSGVAKKDTIALRTLCHLHDNRESTDGFNGLLHIQNVPDIDGFRHRYAIASQNLRRIEFVSALQDALTCVGRPNPQLLNMAENSDTVLRDGVANAGYDGVLCERLTPVKHVHAALIHD